MPWLSVCDAASLELDTPSQFEVGDLSFIVIRSTTAVHACEAICPHMEERLADGFFDGERLTCSKHLWQWDIVTGAPVELAEAPLRVYETRVEDGRVHVLIPPA